VPNRFDTKVEWYEDSGCVIIANNGKWYEIGTVVLHTLSAAIVGCTYYHHTLPTPNYLMDFSLKKYKQGLKKNKQAVEKMEKHIQSLHKKFPEISVKGLYFESAESPDFIDLAIEIPFPIPYLPEDCYQDVIFKKLTEYIALLGVACAPEILQT
jgi:hypothetical protein